MFGALRERTIAIIRWSLVVGWLVLIASLFHDPVTARFTDPTAAMSPFRLNRLAAEAGDDGYMCPIERDGTIDWGGNAVGECDSRCTRVRGECVIERPYPMGARFFWTMALPALPLAFMLLGHEAWRRICPLSALMQVPRKLGIQRRIPHLNRASGNVQWRHVFIGPDSWLGRHPSVLPFALLCLGVTIRLLFINSNRVALAVFFLFVIAAAMTVGYLFGGKTWCHYVCPLSPVQKIYTEPRGLFESWPHVDRAAIPQSMCRTSGSDGDVSTCVGCMSACPDIDLERQYWTRLHEPGRRFVHYGYVGMIFGFYGYYGLYAGNWSYYFSGAWTHEEGQLAGLLSPGFFWLNDGTWFVKALAAPLTIALSVVAAFGIGIGIEKALVALSKRSGRALSEELVRHRSYIVSGALAINAFYFFGGRPNINLMPTAVSSVLDVFIVAVSAVWLARAWGRTPRTYTVESVGSRLRSQLGNSQIDLSDALDGRALEELSFEEVYALGKVLPKVDATARRRLYRDMLSDLLASNTGALGSVHEMARELREQLNLDDDVHREVMAELGAGGGDVDAMLDAEALWRTNAYRDALAALVRRQSEAGIPIAQAFATPDAQREILVLQGAYRITDAQHATAVDALAGTDGAIVAGGNRRMEQVGTLGDWAAYIAESAPDQPLALLARHQIRHAQQKLLRELLRVVASLAGTPEALALVRRAAVAAPEALEALLDEQVERGGELQTWEDRLGEVATAARSQIRFEGAGRVVSSASAPTPESVAAMRHIFSPMTQAALLGWWTTHDAAAACAQARMLLEDDHPDWLVARVARETLESDGRVCPPLLQWVAKLHRTEFYADAAPESIARLLRHSTPVDAERGHVIVRQGDASDGVVCMLDGVAVVHIRRNDGSDLRVAEIRAGETIGEIGLINGEPRAATVSVDTANGRFLQVSRAAFDEYLASESRNVLQLVSRRLTHTLHREAS